MQKVFESAGIKHASPPPFMAACQGATRDEAQALGPKIISPQGRNTYQVRLSSSSENDTTHIELSAVADGGRKVFWFIDREFVGEGSKVFWKGRPGIFIARAVDDQGKARSVQFRVEAVD